MNEELRRKIQQAVRDIESDQTDPRILRSFSLAQPDFTLER